MLDDGKFKVELPNPFYDIAENQNNSFRINSGYKKITDLHSNISDLFCYPVKKNKITFISKNRRNANTPFVSRLNIKEGLQKLKTRKSLLELFSPKSKINKESIFKHISKTKPVFYSNKKIIKIDPDCNTNTKELLKITKLKKNINEEERVNKLIDNTRIKGKDYNTKIKEIGKSNPAIYLIPNINDYEENSKNVHIDTKAKFIRHKEPYNFKNRSMNFDRNKLYDSKGKATNTPKIETTFNNTELSKSMIKSSINITNKIDNIEKKLIENTNILFDKKANYKQRVKDNNIDIIKDSIINTRIDEIKNRISIEELKWNNNLIQGINCEMAVNYKQILNKALYKENKFAEIKIIKKPKNYSKQFDTIDSIQSTIKSIILNNKFKAN